MNTKKYIKIAALFTLIYCISISGYAQVSGPPQPEVSGFEPISTTDMVNLVTGDFTYSLPIVHVPGDNGGFSVALSYHAGIELNEDASWVGLGWSLNPGAIVRDVNEFPDDFSGEIRYDHFSQPGGEQWSVDFIVGNISNDSEKGFGGSIGLSILRIGFGTQLGISAFGITIDEEGTHIDPVGVALAIADLATAGATSKAIEMASSSIGGKAFNTARSLFPAIASNIAFSSGANMQDLWTIERKNYILYKEIKYYLNAGVSNRIFGSLYLGEMPEESFPLEQTTSYDWPFRKEGTSGARVRTKKFFDGINNSSVASDMHMYKNPVPYSENLDPTSIAYDNYNVMGESVSGRIQPYRKEVGSLARLSFNEEDYFKLNVVPYTANKIEFRYPGELANYYQHHQSNTSNGYGFDLELFTASAYQDWPCWVLLDEKFYSQRIEPDREGLYNGKLATGSYICWYTNEEIYNNAFNTHEFLDFLPEGDRQSFRDITIRRTNEPIGPETAKSIGGFSITKADGLTYHYALPVYNVDQTTWSEKEEEDFESRVVINTPYVTTWLLTGITGPDFIDRGPGGVSNGTIDENDWGYWVKFEYGKFGNHAWSSPKEGKNYSPKDIGHTSYSSGEREIYYLDEIKTRTHTAIFVKDTRKDGVNKGTVVTYEPINNYSSPRRPLTIYRFNYLEIESTYDYKSLLLKNIIILKNPAYAKLTQTSSAGGLGLAKDISADEGFHKYSKLWDANDFGNWQDNQNTILNFIYAKQLSRINLLYSYDLCKGAPGTESLTMGKLTLNSLQLFKKNNAKPSPDFIFKYGNINSSVDNPSYHEDKWDGWGMYKSDGAAYTYTRSAVSNGDEWSLKEIYTPLGGKISIEYERDSYSNISGYPLEPNYNLNEEASNVTFSDINNLQDLVHIGDLFDLELRIKERTAIPNFPGFYRTTGYSIEKLPVTVTSVNNNSFQFTPNLVSYYQLGEFRVLNDFTLDIPTMYKDKIGGDIRVSTIKSIDENANENAIHYVYTLDGAAEGVSSGACSVEPEFVRGSDKNNYFYNLDKELLFDYPNTPVMYSKVTMYTGINQHDPSEYLAKTVYEFDTPEGDMVSLNYTRGQNEDFHSFKHSYTMNWIPRHYLLNIKVNTSKIGRLDAIRSYNSKDQLISETIYSFYNENDISSNLQNIGFYTEGSVLAEMFPLLDIHGDPTPLWYLRLFQTTKNYVPSIPKSVTKNTVNSSTTITNTAYDLFTGNVLETEYNNATGRKYRTKFIPAYKRYQEMGSKAIDPSYKNMLTQEAASYLYKLDANNQVEGTLSASIQTWNDQWAYRNYNEATRRFSDSRETDVWRKHKNFAWKGELNADGTYNNFTDFDWNLADLNQNAGAGWQKAGEIMRYNHYSSPLESKDINGHFAAGKMDVSGTLVEAAAVNANYRCFAFTGFEKVLGDRHGGEFVDSDHTSERMVSADHEDAVIGTNAIAEINAHTGKYYLRINRGNSPKFLSIYDGLYPDMGLQQGKYRASVWVHKNSSDFTTLRVQFNSTSTGVYSTVSKPDKTFTAGDWELLYLDFEVLEAVANSYFRVYVYTGDVAYIDDLRIAPLTSQVTAYVYDEDTDQLTYMLNNNNFAVKYEYDEAGRLIAVHKETENGFEKTNEYAYGYAHRDIVIKRHPYSTIYPLRVCTAESATLYVEAENATNYQWQVSSNGGASYTNVGSNSAQYTARHYSSGSYRYRCIVSNPASSVTSYTITMVVLPSQPVITSQPQNAVYCNDEATFSIEAEGVTSYQWYRKKYIPGPSFFEPIPGATDYFFTVSSTVTDPIGSEYYCEVGSDCSASVNSNTVKLLASEAPSMPGTISGPTEVPPGLLVSYSVIEMQGCTYHWDVPMYGTIEGDPNGAAINVRFNYLPGGGEQLELGDIRVWAVNECGVASAESRKTLYTATP